MQHIAVEVPKVWPLPNMSVGWGEEKSHTFITSDQKKKLYLKFKMMELAVGRKLFKINVEFLVFEVVL